MSTQVFARMQQRYDTAANWTAENPVLLEGEIGIESDTDKFKFGDGVLAWNALPYASSDAVSISSIDDIADVDIDAEVPASDGRALIWANGKWQAGPVVGGYSYQGPSTDPHWNNVLLLLKADGPANSTSFTDLSSYANTLTTQGSAKIASSPAKFGSGSLDCTVGGSRLTLPSGSLFDLPYSANLTLEFFAYLPNNAPAWPGSYAFEMSSFNLGQTIRVVFFNNFGTDVNNGVDVIVRGAQLSNQNAVAFPIGQWFHFAATWDGSFVRAFINGTLIGSATRSDNGSLGNAQTIAIAGRGNGNNSLLGYMDEVRLTANIARYTSNFTPPVATFSAPGPVSKAYSIDNLSDVDTATAAPTNGQVLTWNGTNWVPGAAGGDPASIDALTDVDTTTSAPASGQVLTWDGAAQQWKPLATPKTIASQGDYNLRLQPNATSGRWNTQVFSGFPGTGQFRVISTNRVFIAYSDSLGNNLTNTFNSVFANYSAVVTVWLSSDGVNWSQRSSQSNTLNSSNAYLDLQILSSFTFGSTVYLSTSDPSAGPATIALANRNVLAYNSATQKWEPTPINADFLSDVDTTTAAPTNDQALVWNGTNWVPRTSVLSSVTGITGAGAVTNCISISQANYDAIAVKDPNTLYVIV